MNIEKIEHAVFKDNRASGGGVRQVGEPTDRDWAEKFRDSLQKSFPDDTWVVLSRVVIKTPWAEVTSQEEDYGRQRKM